MLQFLLFWVLISPNSQTWALLSKGLPFLNPCTPPPLQPQGSSRELLGFEAERGPGKLLHNARIQSTMDKTTWHPGSCLGRRAGTALPHFNLVTISIWSLHLAWFSLLVHFSHVLFILIRIHCPPYSHPLNLGGSMGGLSPSWGKEDRQLQVVLQVLPDNRRPALSWHSTCSLRMKNDPPP